MAKIFPPPLFSASEQDFTTELRPKFNAQGLIPAIAQDVETGEILMMAWMNQKSLERTIKTGKATYWSRSRGKLWEKGKTSGHTQTVVDMLIDCDQDTIVLKVQQVGGACHTGQRSCFYRRIDGMRLVRIGNSE
ncbi:MAG: phosphoribosyl-AMP cyclohydrolase [Pseudomonadota bacterium]